MIVKKTFCIFVSVLFFSGCAQRASTISPTYTSPLIYQHYSCDQIRQELVRVNSKVMEVTGQQDSAANKDTAALAVGMILFWPALFFMVGGDKKEELARLKGEYEALEKCAIEKKCSIAAEIEEARKQREEYQKKSKPVDNRPQGADWAD